MTDVAAILKARPVGFTVGWPCWLVGLLVVSCAPAPRAGREPVPVFARPQPPAQPDASGPSLPPTEDAGYLVWEDSESWKTTWYEVRGDDLVERGSVAGIVIATSTQLWRIEAQIEEFQLPSCAKLTNAAHYFGDEPGAGSVTHVWSTALGSQTRQALLAPKRPQKLVRFEHTALALGAVGTTLFLQEKLLSSNCGPNENVTSVASTLDVESGERVEVLEAGERTEVLTTAGATARERLINTLPETHGDYRRPEAVELVQLRPSYGATGELRLDARFGMAAPFGLGDPDWSTQMATELVPLDRVPRALRSAPSIPIRLLHHPKRKVLRGFSKLTAAQVDALTALGGDAGAGPER